ncbi:MAG: hypothetical protein AXW15_06165 [Neptuniibacter sp. Phe_28]|nr:MAG: hypothetical protein AXW15_06165 [Neptuniibacter sp. Phe_28]
MYTPEHDLSVLFQQLGLPHSHDEITQFIETHKIDDDDQLLAAASFRSKSQSDFLSASLKDDSEWSELVDELDAMLR